MFEFGIKDIIDILLVALMLYYIYRLMKESRSLNVFIGIIVFVLVWLFVSQVLEMRLLHIRLQPENHTMDPIIVPDCRILGKVAGVFRKM